jgi:hypothetical protein
MTGDLAEALTTLLTQALPGLLGGDSPPVRLSVTGGLFDVDPRSADAAASEPRPDDRTDEFPFDPASPGGPYTLTQPPYPGPRRVRLVTADGDRLPLREDEVVWDGSDPRRFSLAPRPGRDLASVARVQVLYGVTAVFTTVKTADTVLVQLQAAEAGSAALEQAEALVVAVIALNRQQLVDEARRTYEEGDYGATTELKGLALLKGTSPAADTRLLTLQAEAEVKATRALRDDEGRPIVRILTPGRPVDPSRPIDIRIDVES